MALDRKGIAARLGQDIEEGWVVNLGIGMPTLVTHALPAGREIILQSENGVIGFGPPADPPDPWMINASKEPIGAIPGTAIVHHADSFAMIRGGHVDLCVLGAFEVAANGDLANWATSSNDLAPAVGGAMDLAVGAKQVWVTMEHSTRDGRPKIVERLSYPPTGLGCVRRIYTNLAVIDVTASGLVVTEMFGCDFAALQAQTAAPLRLAS
ncbi:MAG: 3-oxoadipate CoA-transferase [Acetobacteraceae bacterium]|nr:3-oxoadipate CoA-transferase [Acetobacteraceae bacterium]